VAVAPGLPVAAGFSGRPGGRPESGHHLVALSRNVCSVRVLQKGGGCLVISLCWNDLRGHEPGGMARESEPVALLRANPPKGGDAELRG
jgi:hypothetical protein